MRTLSVLLLSSGLAGLTGCSSTNATEFLKAASADKATACIATTVGGTTIIAGRTNSVHGQTLEVSGSSCKIQ